MKAKLVAESLQEYAKFGNDNNELNEGLKSDLESFVKDPENNAEGFTKGFVKTDAVLLKKAANLSKDVKVRLAKESLAKMQKDSGLGYPKIFYDRKAKKIWGGAVGSESKGATGK